MSRSNGSPDQRSITGTDFLQLDRGDAPAGGLTDWLAHTPPSMVAQTLNLDPAVIAKFPKNIPDVMPA